MSNNESLYLKYRPKTFKEVIGHAEIVRGLKGSLEAGSNHSFLLTGPSGTGKTTLARICAGVLKADIQEIDAATFTGIDAMRDVLKTTLYRPMNADVKIIIIDECHRLSGAAWDSMLKSLEEPPAWLYYFLCTTNPGKVPKTIATRCTTFQLKPLPIKDILELLDYVSEEEKILLDETGSQIISMCAKAADGSFRQALVNLDACKGAKNREEAGKLLVSAEELTEAHELAAALIKKAPWDELKGLLETLKEQNPEGVRHVVRAYVTKVIMNSKKPDPSHFAVLEAFSQPFNDSDQMSPLVLAVGGLFFAK